MPSGRQRKLDAVAALQQRRYRPRALGKAAPTAEPLRLLPTTFPELDAALGGGVPRGRITELSGQPTSGKATLAARLLASAQADRDALGAWLDLGCTCDPDYLHRCGLDLDRLLVVRPRDPADALAIALHLVQSQALAALVFDSVTGLAEADEGTVAAALAHLVVVVTRTETAVIFLSEPRAASRSLAHAAAVRLDLHREEWLARGADVLGYTARADIVKHKLGRPPASVTICIALADGEPA